MENPNALLNVGPLRYQALLQEAEVERLYKEIKRIVPVSFSS